MSGRLDHSVVNLPLDNRGNGSLDAQIDRNVKHIAAEREAERKRSQAEYRERNKPVPFTREELNAAKAIRTSSGWHRIIRVNGGSVTVETGYSWTDRYAIEKILEVKS